MGARAVAQLAAKVSRIIASPYVSTPPTVNNEDAESVVPLDDTTAKGSPAASAHGGGYPGAAIMPQLPPYADQGPMMSALYEANGALHPLPVSLAVRAHAHAHARACRLQSGSLDLCDLEVAEPRHLPVMSAYPSACCLSSLPAILADPQYGGCVVNQSFESKGLLFPMSRRIGIFAPMPGPSLSGQTTEGIVEAQGNVPGGCTKLMALLNADMPRGRTCRI